MRDGRLFADYTEKRFDQLLDQVPEFELVGNWLISDLRPGRPEDKWLNILLR